MRTTKMIFTIMLFMMVYISVGQHLYDTVTVQAKKWSRDKSRNIVYSDWTPFQTQIMNADVAKKTKADKVNGYGGFMRSQYKASGFFSVHLSAGRAWLIDPQGKAFIATALNSVRKGSSPLQESSFNQKFGDDISWMKEVRKNMDDAGFNMLGSWSDTGAIRKYNQAYPTKGIPYTTQLSLLASYAQQQHRSIPEKKAWPVLAFAFEKGFFDHCVQRCKTTAVSIGDPWLVGHFSDNELPFQNNLIKEFLQINDKSSSAYMLAREWAAQYQLDSTSIPKEIQEKFAAYVADLYYATAAKAIKSVDPNHLYLGSRLHASAKTNQHLLKAAAAYLDVISINYYGNWQVSPTEADLWNTLTKPFMITEFYTKAEDSGLPNITGAGWLVKTQAERGYFYQHFCLRLLSINNCVGWHWFRYQDNDPADPKSDPSNNDSNKGIVDSRYQPYEKLIDAMKQLNRVKYFLTLTQR